MKLDMTRTATNPVAKHAAHTAKHTRWGWLLLPAAIAGIACSSPSPHLQAKQTATATSPRPTSTPYAGDPAVFDSPGRDKRLQIDRVMKLLGIGTGKTVADIGAGGGWFSVRAARKVGPSGMVYAEEINPAAVTFIEQRAAREKLPNVHAVLGTADDPRLPADSVDAVLMLKMYHEIARPVEVMQRLRLSLRSGAKVGIIDRNGDGTGEDHGVPQATIEREMKQAGFTETASYDFTRADGEDYFLIFQQR